MESQGNGTFQSSGLKGKVDRLMDTLWAGGVNNPMESIEQIGYLVFLRLMSEQDEALAALQPNYQPIFRGSGRNMHGEFRHIDGG